MAGLLPVSDVPARPWTERGGSSIDPHL